jgi:chromosome segregation ATPase
MARPGVTQALVNAAADALLHAGERPTIERVRAHLGTGSPNTLNRLLDTWWQDLGRRLQHADAKLALPAAPADVVRAAAAFWEQALAAAQTHTEARLAVERAQLQQAREELEAERASVKATLAQSAVDTEQARHAMAVSEARLAELQALSEHQQRHLADLGQQRDNLVHRIGELTQSLTETQLNLQEVNAAAAVERERAAAHIRATEDRAYAEVDRAREEAKGLRSLLDQVRREIAQYSSQLLSQKEALAVVKLELEREVATQRGRADVLEQQLTRLTATPSPAPRRRKPTGGSGGMPPNPSRARETKRTSKSR